MGGSSGTSVHFKPDSTLFESTEYQWDTLAGRLRERHPVLRVRWSKGAP